MNANKDFGNADHGVLGLARMREAETEWFIVLIRAGHGLRGTMFPVKGIRVLVDSVVLEEEADF